MADPRPCWEINERWPKFCAALANGRGRCRKGTCSVIEAKASTASNGPTSASDDK